MKRATLSNIGFTLVEVIITIGVVSFAFVGLLGVFPLALEQSRSCIDETRSAQLGRMVFATLVGENFNSAKCFADSGTPLDLATLNEASAPVVLYASYDVRDVVKVVRTAQAPPNAEYRLELRFQPAQTTGGISRGTFVRLQIMGEPQRKGIAFEATQFVCKSSRAVLVK
jgi:uncharacterized protein (TIGR02598 family)